MGHYKLEIGELYMKSCSMVKGFQFRNGGKLITDFVRGLNHTPFLITKICSFGGSSFFYMCSISKNFFLELTYFNKSKIIASSNDNATTINNPSMPNGTVSKTLLSGE